MATVSLSLYMWRRIREMGIQSVMGLPGDFNMNFLDTIKEVDGLKWTGNANELNSAYAADGYARVKGIPGCLVTTHGVGELSAINGIAGAASEMIPVIHIVGQTARRLQENHMMIHHSIGFKPDHQLYNKVSKPLRCTAAELWDPKEAPAEIDRVLRECVIRRLPVYIFFPLDLSAEQVPADRLNTKLDLSFPTNKDNERAAVEAIKAKLYQAKSPAVFIDYLTCLYSRNAARALVDKLKIPVYTAIMSKGVIDENHPNYVGVYNGALNFPGISEAMNANDLVIALGWWPADTNTSFFSRNMPEDRRITLGNDHVVVCGKTFDNVYIKPLLERLASDVETSSMPKVTMPNIDGKRPAEDQDATAITQTWLWPRFNNFFKPGDVVIGETGTAAFGIPDSTFPADVTYYIQQYYGSIGYSLPSALGADVALQEIHDADPAKPRRRTVLFIGDGSAQLTIQEVGTMVARGLKPILIIINNDGYTIERAIHGAREKYNDISQYNWSAMLSFFGAKNPEKCFRSARTKKELDAALADPALKEPKEVQVLEIYMDKLDIPWRLAKILGTRDPEMGRMLIQEGFTNSH